MNYLSLTSTRVKVNVAFLALDLKLNQLGDGTGECEISFHFISQNKIIFLSRLWNSVLFYFMCEDNARGYASNSIVVNLIRVTGVHNSDS